MTLPVSPPSDEQAEVEAAEKSWVDFCCKADLVSTERGVKNAFLAGAKWERERRDAAHEYRKIVQEDLCAQLHRQDEQLKGMACESIDANMKLIKAEAKANDLEQRFEYELWGATQATGATLAMATEFIEDVSCATETASGSLAGVFIAAGYKDRAKILLAKLKGQRIDESVVKKELKVTTSEKEE